MSHTTAALIVLGWLALQVPIGTVVGHRIRHLNSPRGGDQMNTQTTPARGVLPPEPCGGCGAPATAGHQRTGGTR